MHRTDGVPATTAAWRSRSRRGGGRRHVFRGRSRRDGLPSAAAAAAAQPRDRPVLDGDARCVADDHLPAATASRPPSAPPSSTRPPHELRGEPPPAGVRRDAREAGPLREGLEPLVTSVGSTSAQTSAAASARGAGARRGSRRRTCRLAGWDHHDRRGPRSGLAALARLGHGVRRREGRIPGSTPRPRRRPAPAGRPSPRTRDRGGGGGDRGRRASARGLGRRVSACALARRRPRLLFVGSGRPPAVPKLAMRS